MPQTPPTLSPDAALILDQVRGPLVICSADMSVVFANRSFRDAFLLGDLRTGTSFWTLDDARWDTPELRRLLEGGPFEQPVREEVLEEQHPTLGRRSIRVSVRPHQASELALNLVVLSIEDLGDRRPSDGFDQANLEQKIKERTQQLEKQRLAALKMAEAAEQAKVDALEAAAALQRADVQLRQSQKMEAVGQLAGGIAHDFNNLLTAILNFSDFVMEKMKPSEPSYADMEEIQKAANRAADLTRQLLAFSRRRTIEPKILDPNDQIVALRLMLKRLLNEGIELVTPPSSTRGTVRVDPTALEQIIVNLAVNASDAMPHGGQLVLETGLATLDESYAAAKGTSIPPGEYVTISVSDTGLGMDEMTRQHIFEPFFTTKAVGSGTGLGLSTVYGIVKQAGGFIWVYSEPAKGTTFRVYFPKVEAPPSVVPVSPHGRLTGGNETILIAEDDQQIRELCARSLTSLGYRVIAVGSGKEALTVFAQKDVTIDLLLTDVIMPRMSGKQLAIRLGQLHPFVKVLFMSGYTSNVIVHHGVVDDDVVLLQKPFTRDGIARKVRAVLDTDAYYGRDLLSRRPRVLLVDAHADVHAQAHSLLPATYELSVAHTDEEALRQIKSFPPEVVICACAMTGIDGPELYHSVCALNPHLVDHFMFTAAASDGDPKDLLCGIERPLIRKPFEGSTLLDAVQLALSGRSPERDQAAKRDRPI